MLSQSFFCKLLTKIERGILISFGLMFFLCACTSTPHPEGKPLPTLTFANEQPIPVNVRHIEVIDKSGYLNSPITVLSPRDVLTRFLKNRFSPAGNRDQLDFIIEDIQVVQGKEQSKDSLGKFFGVAGHDVYQIKVTVQCAHLDDGERRLYSNRLRAQRTLRVTEHASVAEREEAQFATIENLIHDIEKEVTRVVLSEMKLAI